MPLTLKTTKDAGHTYDSYTVSSSTLTDPSLLVDPGTNLHRVIASTVPSSGVATISVFDASKDGEQSDWGGGTAITGITGAYPCCLQHPQDSCRVAMSHLQAGALKLAMSYDFGAAASWAALTTIVSSGLSFITSGRGALAWLGEGLLAAWCDGSALKCAFSADGGHSFGSVVSVATAGPYYGVTACSGLGAFYLMAVAMPSTSATTVVYRSGDLGATWTALASPTPMAPGTPIAFLPEDGRLLAGTTQKSADDGATFATA